MIPQAPKAAVYVCPPCRKGRHDRCEDDECSCACDSGDDD